MADCSRGTSLSTLVVNWSTERSEMLEAILDLRIEESARVRNEYQREKWCGADLVNKFWRRS